MTSENLKFGSITLCLDEVDWLAGCLELLDVDEKVVVVANRNFKGEPVDQSRVVETAKKCGATVLYSKGHTETEQRNEALKYLHDIGIEYALIVDADEYWTPNAIRQVKTAIQETRQKAYKSHMRYFYKKPDWEVDLDQTAALVAISTNEESQHPRNFPDYRREDVDIFHFSYVRTPEELKNKLSSFSHSHELVPDYFDVWDKATLESKNLHPVNPGVYRSLKKVTLPDEIWNKIPRKYR